ncbi:Putative addiction module domain-containing protein, CHP02574 [Desulfonema limicola]|uniref:Addiction module domain-containing protein, CHP02574 n=1 Tax=Desulfonema limicola TaxID=45656 RepID=A0A975B833_9BACT|nr:addiction module protein [Desulfonema limicola]QTA80568.1 Putative addiction module domain-containing protein, CHP02574 [Desulfonema limicola]
MITTDELLFTVESLPLELKIEVVEKLLNSLNPPHKKIDELWADEAERRVNELKTGKVKTIPGEEVFKEIQERLSR